MEILPLVSAQVATLAEIEELLLKFPKIVASEAVALIRAARLYSNALWWSNEDPNFAWLQLVSAIEVAANSWQGQSRRRPGVKFREFVGQFQQGPPEVRPSEYGQVDWAEMDSHLRIIYRHRNAALHDGIPFPGPMLWRPNRDHDNNLCELPLGMSASSGSSSWMANEYPLTLQTFEYIVRGSLKAWWEELPEAA